MRRKNDARGDGGSWLGAPNDVMGVVGVPARSRKRGRRVVNQYSDPEPPGLGFVRAVENSDAHRLWEPVGCSG